MKNNGDWKIFWEIMVLGEQKTNKVMNYRNDKYNKDLSDCWQYWIKK